jgi:hypothetical protein
MVTGNDKNVMEKSALKEGFDFTMLSDQGLRDLVPHPMYGNFVKKLLENRGYYVSIKNGKAKLRKKTRK